MKQIIDARGLAFPENRNDMREIILGKRGDWGMYVDAGRAFRVATDYRDIANQYLSFRQKEKLPKDADGYYGLSWRELLIHALKDAEQFIYREAYEGDWL